MLEYEKYEKDLVKLGYIEQEQRIEIIQTLWNFIEVVINTYNKHEEE